jgi:amidase
MRDDVTNILEVNGVSGGYGKVPILHGIEFTVAENEVVGVLGHNGMGKTTLLKTLMGFLPSSAGTIRFDSTDITAMAPFERAGLGLGYVPQGRGIFPQLSVRDNLRFAWHEYSGASERDVMDAVLTDFARLRPLLDREGGALSGGEQQLLALARCLMGDPDFLLLDEPTEGIQPSIIEEIGETLLALRESRGLSILLVEQNFDFISDLSDRVLVLERGRIAGELCKADLSNQAKSISSLASARHVRRGDSPSRVLRLNPHQQPKTSLGQPP